MKDTFQGLEQMIETNIEARKIVHQIGHFALLLDDLGSISDILCSALITDRGYL